MIHCSAPGKVYLFGEHAVVYGEPAIACAIDKRVFTSIRLKEGSNIRVTSMNKRLNCNNQEFRYVCAAAKKIKDLCETDFGAEIAIKSQLPPSQGLGSSAAVTVSTLMALSESLGMGLKDYEIAKIGHEVELYVQGTASQADTLVTSIGGVVLIAGIETLKINFLSMPIVIGATGITRSTSDVIKMVATLKTRYPKIVGSIISSIGEVTRQGKSKLIEGDITGIGELMDINQGLLESLRVSTLELNNLIYGARRAGAFGAKITGAGGGGCMFAIAQGAHIGKVAREIKLRGGRPIKASFSDIGVAVD